MNIIHARNNLLPEEITFPTLVNLAILVDKYNFHDSVTRWARGWACHLQIQVPKTICNELACCICVSWVFRLPVEFAKATAVANKKVSSAGLFATDYGYILADTIPLPIGLADRFELNRLTAMMFLGDSLDAIVDILRSPEGCEGHDDNCNAFTLGKLERSSVAKNLWPFRKDYPYSHTKLVQILQALDIGLLCEFTENSTCTSVHNTIADKLNSDIASIKKWADFCKVGIPLEEYKI
jgi:hypothetical protein